MTKTVKKAIVYSLLVGMAQFGLTTATLEASPRSNMHQQHERYTHEDNERQHRNELEMQRHDREMARRDYENAQDWNDRQWRENERHDNTMNEIAAGIIGILIGTAIN